MRGLDIVLYLIAAACFLLAAAGTNTRVNLIAAGLFAGILVPLIAEMRSSG